MPAELSAGGGAGAAPAGAARHRVFFALWPEAPLAERLAAVAGDCAARYGGRPSRRQTIHLTLAFIGDIAAAAIPDLCRAAAALRGEPFALTVDRLAYWPHNRLLWAGCSAVPTALSRLVGDLDDALRGLGVTTDLVRRGFTPHVSLLRSVVLPEGGASPTMPPVFWPCRRFVLVRSRLSSAGPDYQIVAEFPLVP